MDNESKKIKQVKSEKIYAVVPKSLKEKVVRYKAKGNMSESEIINVALNEFIVFSQDFTFWISSKNK